MSRMGKKPITVPEKVTIDISNNDLICKGPKGENKVTIHRKIKVEQSEKEIIVKRHSNDKISKSLHGVTRKNIINAIEGVLNGFEKKLDINGVGYRAKLTGKNLEMSLGFSHPIKITPPENIEFKVIKNSIIVSGNNKQLVGEIAANIRKVRPPEPYKGKGIKYHDEVIIKKAGKAAKAAGEAK